MEGRAVSSEVTFEPLWMVAVCGSRLVVLNLWPHRGRILEMLNIRYLHFDSQQQQTEVVMQYF